MSPFAPDSQAKKVTFAPDAGFYRALKKRVDAYFKEKGLAKTGGWRMLLKTGIVLSVLVASYVMLVFFSTSLPMAALSVFLLGQSLVLVGFNVMHDGGHGSYSSNRRINWLAGFSLDLIGGNQMLWRQKHNILHHTYTNIDELDDDIHTSGLLRLSPAQKWRPWHVLQHLYALPLYGFLSLLWIIIDDFVKLSTGRIGNYQLAKPSRRQLLLFFLAKSIYFGYALVLPSFFHPILHVVIGFVAVHFVLGFTISIVFQLAHTVEGNSFPSPVEATGKMENDWAVHQVRTTADFAPTNWLATWYLGGLNFQVEHHLFSKISHVHYPAIQKLVKETSQEFDVPYSCFPSLISAILAHYRFLRSLARRPALAA